MECVREVVCVYVLWIRIRMKVDFLLHKLFSFLILRSPVLYRLCNTLDTFDIDASLTTHISHIHIFVFFAIHLILRAPHCLPACPHTLRTRLERFDATVVRRRCYHSFYTCTMLYAPEYAGMCPSQRRTEDARVCLHRHKKLSVRVSPFFFVPSFSA